MMKNYKNLLILIAAGLMVACGAADSTSDQETKIIDETAPILEKTIPNVIIGNNGSLIVPIETKSFSFYFDEALSNEVINALQDVKFVSSTNSILDGEWSYDTGIFLLTYTFDLKNDNGDEQLLPLDEIYELIFSDEIQDNAGNFKPYTLKFKTPQSYDIAITTKNLPVESSIVISIIDTKNSTVVESTIIENGSLDMGLKFAPNTTFTLAVKNQPSNNTFCAFDLSSGIVVNGDARVNLTCSDIVPLVASAANWNNYYYQTSNSDSNTQALPRIHGGEKRILTMPNLDNCDGLVISDALDAFEWTCEVDNTSTPAQAIIQSTQLKSNKSLSDLIQFSSVTPKWRTNSVSVKKNNSELNGPITPSIWWNNPIKVTSSNILLNESDTIYIVVDSGEPVFQQFKITAARVAFLIEPGFTLDTQGSKRIGIDVNQAFAWIEGSINAQTVDTGISVLNGYYTHLRNVTVKNAKTNGVSINGSESSVIHKLMSSDNGGTGFSLVDSSQYTNASNHLINDLSVFNNADDGAIFNSSHVTVKSITARNNQKNGLVVSINTTLSEIHSSNNTKSGISIEGHNNTLSLVDSHSNDVGITFNGMTAAPQNNIILSATLMNNYSAAVKFINQDTSVIDSNIFHNTLDAYNTENTDSTCGVPCSNNQVLTTTDSISLFADVPDDSNFSNYDTISNLITNARVFSQLDSLFRGWGSSLDATTDSSIIGGTGSCSDGNISNINTCIIRDASLNLDDTLAREINSLPATNSSHTYLGDTTSTFLNNSVEMLLDGIGNDDGLCEDNETCLFTSNVGSYQGHGDMQIIINDSDPFWTDRNIVLKKYTANGR